LVCDLVANEMSFGAWGFESLSRRQLERNAMAGHVHWVGNDLHVGQAIYKNVQVYTFTFFGLGSNDEVKDVILRKGLTTLNIGSFQQKDIQSILTRDWEA
jgi:hypothetical protein